MTEDYYKKALQAARAELADLTRQKDEMEKRIAQLRQTIVSLAVLSEEDESEDDEVFIPSAVQRAALNSATMVMKAMAGRKIGFSDACREVLKAADDYMTPLEVRDGLIRMGIDLDTKYTNPLAVIHRTLKRLEESKEIDTMLIDGKTNYRWKSSLPRYSKKLTTEAARRNADTPIIDVFSGKGSTTDIVITNPPYAETTKKRPTPIRYRPKREKK